MRNLSKITLLLSWMAALLSSVYAEPTSTAATEFIRRQHVGDNLKVLGLAAAQNTQTFAMIVNKIGLVEAKKLVSTELDVQAQQFEKQWNENLAIAYSHNFTSEELTLLASEGRYSKYLAKLNEKQGVVSEEMRRRSTPV